MIQASVSYAMYSQFRKIIAETFRINSLRALNLSIFALGIFQNFFNMFIVHSELWNMGNSLMSTSGGQLSQNNDLLLWPEWHENNENHTRLSVLHEMPCQANESFLFLGTLNHKSEVNVLVC